MTRRKIMPILAILILVLDPKTAAEGVTDGISLCLKTVIPALFPFLIITRWACGMISSFQFKKLQKFFHWFGICPDEIGIFLLGTMGGYPTGARIIYDRWTHKQITTESAQNALRYCNNAGPAFLFGVGAILFDSKAVLWILWGIQLISALLTAKLHTHSTQQPHAQTVPSSASFMSSVEQAVKVTGIICAWICVFRIILLYMDAWFLFAVPSGLRVLICGILEVSNGCVSLSQTSPTGLRFVLCSFFMCFGGLSVWMQIASCVGSLGIRHFASGKLCQSAISICLSLAAQFFLFPKAERLLINSYTAVLFAINALIPMIYKKTVAIPKNSLYNKKKQKEAMYAISQKAK